MKKCVLGDICTKIGSGATPTGGRAAYAEEGVSLIRSQNVLDLTFSYGGLAYLNDSQADKLKSVAVQPNDVLLNITGDSVARSCMVDEKVLPARVNQHVAIVRVKKEVANPYYIMLWLVWQKKRLLLLASNGATRHALTKEMIEELPIDLPTLAEQSKIALLLSTIDRKIALNRKRIATLEAMAKEIYDYWFVQFDFPDAHGRPYKSSGGAMVYNPDLKREIPKGWEVRPLADAVKELNSGEWGSDACGESSSVQVHCLRGADMEDQSHLPVRYISERKADKLLNVGDIVIEMSGGSPTQATGRSCYVSQGLLDAYNGKLTCTNFCNSLKLKELDETSYFFFVWRMFYRAGLMFNFEGKTSGLKNLQIDSLLTTKWVFPPKELATKFNKLFLTSTAQTDNCKKEISRLSALRDFLLPLLMNGQVKVGLSHGAG